MKRLLVLVVCLMVLLSPLLAQEKQSSEEPMVPLALCEKELRALETKSIEQLTKLSTDFEVRLREAVTGAAADTARPLMVEIAGLKAERDYWQKEAVRRGRVGCVVAGVLGGLTFAGFAGWILSVVIVK